MAPLISTAAKPSPGSVRGSTLEPASTRVPSNGNLVCLRHYRAVMDEHRVSQVRATATSAVRDALNRDAFLHPATEAIGVPVELLAASQEAALSFLGATSELDPETGPYLVIDIGGGSTEFAFGADQCRAWLSADIGCVRLTERYIHHDPPLPEELAACLQVTEAHLDDVVREIPQIEAGCLPVGVAGTVTTAAAVELGLATYDRDRIHHFWLARAAAEDVFRTLAIEAKADRIHNPGLELGRADVIVAGMCILIGVMRYFDFDRCLVSEADILDGLAMSLLGPTIR